MSAREERLIDRMAGYTAMIALSAVLGGSLVAIYRAGVMHANVAMAVTPESMVDHEWIGSRLSRWLLDRAMEPMSEEEFQRRMRRGGGADSASAPPWAWFCSCSPRFGARWSSRPCALGRYDACVSLWLPAPLDDSPRSPC